MECLRKINAEFSLINTLNHTTPHLKELLVKANPNHPQYERVWERYREFALTSRKLKSNWELWQRIFLSMAIIGTLLAAAGSQTTIMVAVQQARILGFMGALFLAVGAFLSKELFSPSSEILWAKARAMAEALKSECFLFATGVPPYDGVAAEEELRKIINNQIGNVAQRFPGGLVKADGKLPPLVPMSFDTYITERIVDQSEYYSSASKRAYKSFQQWRTFQIAVGALAVALGVYAGFCNVEHAARVNAFIVLSGAILGITTSYSSMKHGEFLSKSYGGLRSRMQDLAAEGKSCTDYVAFVKKCETELCAEHQSWLAECFKKPAGEAVVPTGSMK